MDNTQQTRLDALKERALALPVVLVWCGKCRAATSHWNGSCLACGARFPQFKSRENTKQ